MAKDEGERPATNIREREAGHEEAEEELEVEYVGEKLSIGFNVNYLLDALSALTTDQFSLGLSSPDHSGLLLEPGNDNCKYVIMPMRL